MTPSLQIGARTVGTGERCFVIAELSGNHGGDLERAARLVDAAAAAGADAVKLQTYTADTITIDSDAPHFRIESGTLWDGRTLHSLYEEAMTPWEWHPELARRAAQLGLECFSSPFDDTAVDFLERQATPAYKISAFELVDLPLIRRVAATGKPVILSTGMASLDEIGEAVDAARGAGAEQLALLACSSAYPAPPESINLRRIPHLADTFNVVAGLSDHTVGITVPVASIALGAAIIEKHLCLSRAEGGPDVEFSLEPDEFGQMVEAVRTAELALGAIEYGSDPAEDSSRGFRRSLFVVEDVGEGEELTLSNVRSIRPGGGLHTRHLEEVLGRRASHAIERGTPLSWELLRGSDDGMSLRETEIRPDSLMAEQARHYEADVAWLLKRRDRFVDVACPACGAEESEPMWRKYELDFVACCGCKTVYMTPRPSPDLLDEYYRTSENYEYWSRVVFPASEAARRQKIFRPRAERVTEIAHRHGSTMGTLIDVGAGFGTFCEETGNLGSFERVVAIEPEPHLAAICRERGLEVIEAPIEQVDLGAASVDVLTAFEVIEHLFSPADLIARCREVVVPGGLVILTCPNAKGFDVVQLGALASAVDTEHLNYFHPGSLTALLADQGFEVLESRTPGLLDAEIVRKRALAGEHDLDAQPFLRQILIDDWETYGDSFQGFLVESGLSSNMWIVARRAT